MEEWKKIKNFSNYSVSTAGRVRNDISGKILKQVDSRGYKRVGIYSAGFYNKKLLVHRIVAESFLGNDKSLPVVNHKDGNKSNNSIENLEWCTHSYNISHSYKIGKSTPIPYGEKHHNSKLNDRVVREIRDLYSKGFMQKDIAGRFGIIQQNVSAIVRGITWK